MDTFTLRFSLQNGQDIINAIEDGAHSISAVLPQLSEHMMTLQGMFGGGGGSSVVIVQ